ncbi:MAG: hypothetical protein O7D91_15750 [Planctomycetota bacterium]|nr:hypothetical protein [Planctomycetota bacterium]
MLSQQNLCSLFTSTALIAFTIGANLALSDSAHAQCYQVTVIQGPECPWPWPPAGISGEGINESGDLVGYYYHCGVGGSSEAFMWTAESGLTTLNAPPGVGTAKALDINDAGQIAGTMGGIVSPDRGFLHDGEFVTLDPPPGGNWSNARAVNNSGQVVGTVDEPGSGTISAALWEGGDLTILGSTLDPWTSASDINELGQVAGYMGYPSPLDPTARGVIWDDGNVTILDPIPGGVTSVAKGINNLGQVVGYGLVPSEEAPLGYFSHPFLWSGGQMTDLGTLPGSDYCIALDINDSGQMIGYCGSSGQGSWVPFFWQDGVMTNVNDLLAADADVSISLVLAINNQGQIAGRGSGPSSGGAVLLTPFPVSRADLDGNCTVNPFDLALLLGNWGPCADCPADINGDGIVNAFDLGILLGSWT